jgi:hypothetical protein
MAWHEVCVCVCVFECVCVCVVCMCVCVYVCMCVCVCVCCVCVCACVCVYITIMQLWEDKVALLPSHEVVAECVQGERIRPDNVVSVNRCNEGMGQCRHRWNDVRRVLQAPSKQRILRQWIPSSPTRRI